MTAFKDCFVIIYNVETSYSFKSIEISPVYIDKEAIGKQKCYIHLKSRAFLFQKKKMNKTSSSNQISSFFIGSYAKYQYVSKLQMQVYIISLIAIVKICSISCWFLDNNYFKEHNFSVHSIEI